jgi:hypothetical protein
MRLMESMSDTAASSHTLGQPESGWPRHFQRGCRCVSGPFAALPVTSQPKPPDQPTRSRKSPLPEPDVSRRRDAARSLEQTPPTCQAV